MPTDAIVVGAGVVGAACAEALAAAGLSVTVLESRFAASGATAAAMGHLVVMDDSEAQFALTAVSRASGPRWPTGCPPACEDERTGTLWIAATRRSSRSSARKAAFYRGARGRRPRSSTGGARARGAEPAARASRARCSCRTIAWSIRRTRRAGSSPARRRAGRACVEGARASRRSAAAACATRTGDSRRAASSTPPGAAAPLLTPGLPVAPRKGHLVITDRYPGFCRRQLVELGYLGSAHTPSASESVAFNLQPRATGQMLLGSSREFVGFDAVDRTARSGRGWSAARSSTCRRSRGSSAIRTWTGFRPATPDNLPLIGAWPETPGLFVAAGHEGLGITTALGTARLVADAVLGRTSPIDPAPYRPTRLLPEAAHA